MPDQLRFEITSIRRVEPKPDGTLRRNWLDLDVTVDGAAHTVRIRRESGTIKSAELEQRQDWPEIRRLVGKYLTEEFLEPALQRMRAARRVTGQQ